MTSFAQFREALVLPELRARINLSITDTDASLLLGNEAWERDYFDQWIAMQPVQPVVEMPKPVVVPVAADREVSESDIRSMFAAPPEADSVVGPVMAGNSNARDDAASRLAPAVGRVRELVGKGGLLRRIAKRVLIVVGSILGAFVVLAIILSIVGGPAENEKSESGAAASQREADRAVAEEAERIAAAQAETDRVAAEQANQAEAERVAAEQAAVAAAQAETDRISAQAAAEAAAAAERQAMANRTSYANCDAVHAAGAAPISTGQPGYSRELDRDGDGVACE